MLAVPHRSDLRARPLETARLLLHPLDATDSRDLWNAVESSRAHLEPWLPWVPFNIDLESSGRYAEASAADWDAARACRFSIRDRTSRRFLGVIGLEAFAHLHESVELGYWLRVDACGRGLMTETALETVGKQSWLDPIADPLRTVVHQAYDAAGPAGQQLKNAAHGVWLGHPLHPVFTRLAGYQSVWLLSDAPTAGAKNRSRRTLRL